MSVAPSPSSDAPASSASRWVRDWFLLERAERQVLALPAERHALVRRYYEAGTRRAIVADDLTDDNGVAPALVLYRDAAILLGAAVVAAVDPQAVPDAALLDVPWDTLAAFVAAGRLPPAPASLDEARRILTPTSRLSYDETSPDALRAQHATVRSALRWLRDQVEPRTVRAIRLNRGVRLAIVGAVVLAGVVRAASSLFAPANIALHKTVTISARHPVSVAPADNSGLVNGEIESNYGIHTTVGNAWVMIDLGAIHRIADIVVHNRADGWYDEGLPFSLELSEDGVHFTEIERHTQHFSASDPWVAAANGRPARFVRISSIHYVTLTEVEVHEAK
jgi:hypothetical protein